MIFFFNSFFKCFLLLFISYLKPDGLMRPDEDANAEVVATNHLGQPGVLCVGQADPVQFHGHLHTCTYTCHYTMR